MFQLWQTASKQSNSASILVYVHLSYCLFRPELGCELGFKIVNGNYSMHSKYFSNLMMATEEDIEKVV